MTTWDSEPKLSLPPGRVCVCVYGRAEFLCMYIYNCCSRNFKTVAQVRGIHSGLFISASQISTMFLLRFHDAERTACHFSGKVDRLHKGLETMFPYKWMLHGQTVMNNSHLITTRVLYNVQGRGRILLPSYKTAEPLGPL